MSLNKAMNAVIALIEERPRLARELLREPTSDVNNVPEVINRLRQALRKYAANEIRKVLIECLRTECPLPADQDSAYFEGVRKVEELFEAHIEELEQ
jgi:hypothetical protein